MARTDSQPIRISKQLLAEASAIAPAAGRSATAQVEYWAQLGRDLTRRNRAWPTGDMTAAEVVRELATFPEVPFDELAAAGRAAYLARLDDVIENGGTAEEDALLAELRAEGGWGADDDGTLIRYDSEGNVLCVVEPAAERG